MAIEAATSERVYLNLKASLLAGRLDPHERLDFAEIAKRLEVSTTPVREGAMRLLGEGLLEVSPRTGLRPVRFTELRLRALLELHEKLVLLAIDWSAQMDPAGKELAAMADQEDAARRAFARLVEHTGNREFDAVLARLADLLAPFRRSEAVLLDDVGPELAQLQALDEDRAGLKRAIRAYHRRRLAIVPQLVWAAMSHLPG